jgi:hypothetical protein
MSNKSSAPYRTKQISSENDSTPQSYVLKVTTNLPETESGYWIKVRRNNQYVPYKPNFNHNNNKTTPDASESAPVNCWTTVASKKKEKPIYYWVVDSHNLFDRRNKAFRLYFTEPDATQIENMDQTNYMAINGEGELRLLHSQLKHNSMKMNPTFYISRTVKQIEDALKFVKYCVVKIENNEQKLIEDPKQLDTYASL